MRQLGRRPELDGIRGLAVAAVLAVHTNERFAGGKLGVDVFFVLSGFLITSLMADEQALAGRVNVRNFYGRRAIRLLPALVVLLVLVAALSAARLGAHTDPLAAVAVVLYVANWCNGFTSIAMGSLSHAWSLAIEEQFYAVWPWIARRLFPSRRAVSGLLVAAIAVMVAREAAALLHMRGVFDVTPLRADGLLLGAALALAYQRRQVPSWATTPLAAVAGVLLMAVAVGADTVRDTGVVASASIAVVSVGACLLTAAVIGDAASVRTVLSLRPLVAVGRVSYGLYLLHYPVFLAVQSRHYGSGVEIALEYGITVPLVAASWFLVERRWLTMRRRFPGAHEVAAQEELRTT